MNIKIKQNIKVIILALILTVGASYVLADGIWTPPTCSPPDCNVDAPINVGDSTQIKTGKLALGSSWTTAIVEGTNYILQLAGSLLVNGQVTINGPIVIKDGTAQAGYVLTTDDTTGLAKWKAPSSAGNLSNINIYSFKSDYYSLIRDPSFRDWFDNYTNGTALLKPLSGPGSAFKVNEGWALNPNGNIPGEPKEKQQITADKLCSYFTGGSAVTFDVAPRNSTNFNTAYVWNKDMNKWQVIVSSIVDSYDIIRVNCLSFAGVNPNATNFLINRPYVETTVCADNKSTYNPSDTIGGVCYP